MRLDQANDLDLRLDQFLVKYKDVVAATSEAYMTARYEWMKNKDQNQSAALWIKACEEFKKCGKQVAEFSFCIAFNDIVTSEAKFKTLKSKATSKNFSKQSSRAEYQRMIENLIK